MSVPVFLLGIIQRLANLFFFFFHVRRCSNFTQFLFGFCCQRLQDRGMDGVLGVLKSRRKRDTVIEKGWRDERRHKEKTGNAVVQEKQISIFEGEGQEPQIRAQEREEKLHIFPISRFFMHTSLSKHGWTGTLGGEGELEKEIPELWMDGKEINVGNKGEKLKNQQSCGSKTLPFEGCLCSVVCSQCNLFKDLLILDTNTFDTTMH